MHIHATHSPGAAAEASVFPEVLGKYHIYGIAVTPLMQDHDSTNPMYMYIVVISMSYTEKIDVLDLLINILREHEEKLDELIARLEAQVPESSQVDDTDQMMRFYESL